MLQKRLSRLEFLSSNVDTVIILTYLDGASEALSITSDSIFISDTLNANQFSQLLRQNARNNPGIIA